MRYLIQPITNFLSRAQARFARSRAGSVLILVVTLLVLMALIGTAWISTARIDRVATAQTSANTQIDLLVEGVVELAKGAIADDLFGPDYRDPSDNATVTNYEHWDAPTMVPDPLPAGTPGGPVPTLEQNDNYLASRFPRLTDPLTAPAVPANPPIWPAITAALIQNAGVAEFESPWRQPGYNGQLTYTTRNDLIPYYTVDTSDNPLPVDGEVRPGFFITMPSTFSALAADADADGIADAGLFKLPIGPINGITYYAAVRIIDNNSAINGNVAWKWNDDFLDEVRGNFFPTNVDLLGLIREKTTVPTITPAQQMDLLNDYRFNSDPAETPPIPTAAYTDIGTPPTRRTDMGLAAAPAGDFASPYDKMWYMSGRRLKNPGYNADVNPTAADGTFDKFQRITIGDQSILAYRSALINATFSKTAALSPNVFERTLSEAVFDVYGTAKFTPYAVTSLYIDRGDANKANFWFNALYDWDDVTATDERRSLRPMLVSSNPVSSAYPSKLVAGPYPAWTSVSSAYQFGQLVTYLDRTWLCIARHTAAAATAPHTAAGAALWEVMSWNNAPAKANINTAPFGELWLAYWHVMSELPGVPPYPTAAAPTVRRMFKSVTRDPRPVATPPPPYELSPQQMLQLRSAIASVNAMDARDSDQDITSRSIVLDGTIDYVVRVYGTERQPFITEVYADNYIDPDPNPTGTGLVNPRGYVAVELHNPYDTDLDISGWQLGIIDRRSTVTYPLVVRPITGFAGIPGPAGTTVIPAYGYALLHNFSAAPTSANDATYIPASVAAPGANTVPVYVTNLHEVIADPAAVAPLDSGGELVLLRPRASTGVAAVSTLPRNPFDETATNVNFLNDWIPLDSFDFTGLAQTAPGGPFTAWHYLRGNRDDVPTAGSEAWTEVYPGEYDPLAAAGTPRYTDCESVAVATGTLPTFAGPAPSFGVGNASPHSFPAIQIASRDFPGPHTPVAFARFPYGTFARAGDILQVPFIGAYRIDHPVDGFIELNNLSIDASYAENDDITVADDASEMIGRFCPQAATPNYPVASVDYYKWASDVFDYLGVLDTMDHHLPAVHAESYAGVLPPQGVSVASASQPPSVTFGQIVPGGAAGTYRGSDNLFLNSPYVGKAIQFLSGPAESQTTTITAYDASNRDITIDAALLSAAPVVGDRFKILGVPEEGGGIEGLININTAPWQVLARLPMVIDPATGLVMQPQNEALAKLIVYWRDIDTDGTSTAATVPGGPFTSIFDLNKVVESATVGDPAFINAMGTFDPAADDADDLSGDTSPHNAVLATPELDSVLDDFEQRFLVLNRISNMITTRSDTFTVYILVQGWRNAGTEQAQLAVQRRAAFIADRTGIISNTTQGQISTTPVPTN